jgi:hypothetical protein
MPLRLLLFDHYPFLQHFYYKKRIFQNMIEKEKQSAILNQNVVGDSQLAIIIDNAKPVLKLPKIAKNR